MKIKNLKKYEDWKNKNKDAYSSCIFKYAEKWADLMEKQMNKGVKLEAVAKLSSLKADTEGITGFMYGMAVNILSEYWEYGEELRKWHNKQYGYNDAEGVVNPSILNITL